MGHENRHGTFLGLPYDFRRLTAARAWRGLWNPDQRRVLIPKAWGWGYGVNLYEIARRLRLVGR